MAELTDEQKLEVVTRLARFDPPLDIIEHFKQQDVEISYSQIAAYDPSKPNYLAGEKWRPIFEAVRKAYLEEVAAIPTANQGWRLNELHRLYDKAIRAKDLKLAAEIVERAAKETGGVFTNVRDLNVADSRKARARDLEPEERQAALAELIAGVIEQMSPDPEGAQPQHPTKQ